MQQQDLFEILKDIVSCDFISDMRYRPYFDRVWQVCAMIDLNMYPLSQLEDVAEYFFGKPIKFATIEQAKTFYRNNALLR